MMISSSGIIEFSTSPYIKALVLISKSDIDGAIQLLGQVARIKPMTAFHKEYINSIGQLVALLCLDPKKQSLISIKTSPLELLTQVHENTKKFFIEELGILDSDETQQQIISARSEQHVSIQQPELIAYPPSSSLYVRNIFTVIRLAHLLAIANAVFSGPRDPVSILKSAILALKKNCPYPAHGLRFLLDSTLSRIHIRNHFLTSIHLFQECM